MWMLRYAKRRALIKAKNAVRSLSYYSDFCLLKPTGITFDITDRCQLKCPTCGKWKTPPELQREELSTEEWKSIILKLKQWLGEFSFCFSGGEPFLRKDIFEIISFAVDNNVHPSVVSNGYGFSSIVEKVVESDLESLHVSLNGLSPSIHDVTRGVEGAYYKTLQFIRDVNLQRKKCESKLRLSVATILMPSNCGEAISLVRWVRDEGIDSISLQTLELPDSFHPYYAIQSIPVKGVNYDWCQENLINAAGSEELNEVIDELIVYKQQGYPISNSLEHLKWMKVYFQSPKKVLHLKCKVGVSNFSIDPYGNVRLCFNMEPIGNIRFTTPKQLYNSRKSREQRQLIRKCDMLCRLLACNF